MKKLAMLTLAFALSLGLLASERTSATSLPAAKAIGLKALLTNLPAKHARKALAPIRKEEAEEKALVVPPAGLVTEQYTLVSMFMPQGGDFIEMLRADDHQQQLRIGFSGRHFYIQGLSTHFPDAWVCGELNADETKALIPAPQYLGSDTDAEGEQVDWFFDGYVMPQGFGDTLAISFSKQDRAFALGYNDALFEYDDYYDSYFRHITPQIVKAVPADDLVTPPAGLAVKDYLLVSDDYQSIRAQLKVGFNGADVYVRGFCPLIPDAWVKGTLKGDEIVFPKWQCFGETDIVGQALAQQGYEGIGSKKFYFYGFNRSTLTIGDVVLQYDKAADTMTGETAVVAASRVNVELAVEMLMGISIKPIHDVAATPRAVEISSVARQGTDYVLAFWHMGTDVEDNGLLTDKLHYRVLTGIGEQTSTVTFRPADYETLQSPLSLIPYGFADGKYFTSQVDWMDGNTYKGVRLKSGSIGTTNQIGIQLVYYGGGSTTESEVEWFTLDDALEMLIDEVYNAQSAYDGNNLFGRDEMHAAIERARNYYDELDGMDSEQRLAVNIFDILDETYALQAAEEAFRAANQETDGTLNLLQEEISNANNLSSDYDYPYLRDPLYEAIDHAQELLDEVLSLDEQAIKEFDMTVVQAEIDALKATEEEFKANNEVLKSKVEKAERLDAEISAAWQLYYDDEMPFDKDELWQAIDHAVNVLYDFNTQMPEVQLEYDITIITNELAVLQEAEKAYISTNTTFDNDEWLVLKDYYQSVNTSSWTNKWDFSADEPSAAALPGVTVHDGHVVAIDLSDNGVSGRFPYELLTLPYLEELNLEDNQLTGDIGEGTTQFVNANGNLTSALTHLDISGNQFSGNIGIIANALPELSRLDASRNRLEEVTPMVPTSVDLDLQEQDIQRVLDIRLQDLADGHLLQSVPNILLYNHYNQEYLNGMYFTFKETEVRDTEVTLREGEPLSIGWYRYAYTGKSGDLIQARRQWNNSYYYVQAYNSSFAFRLYFDQGDADFNGKVDLLDLQTQIDCMFDNHACINFTAANLWEDDIINVQDAVCMVNLLLDQKPTAAGTKHLLKAAEQPTEADACQVFVHNGRLFINATQPVAAFDIIVSAEDAISLSAELARHGLACSTKRADGYTHLIGYSLSGNTLPEGLTEIGSGLSGKVVHAQLAAKGAREIPAALNSVPTGIADALAGRRPADVRYTIPLGTRHAIDIDANGKKHLR